MAKAKDSKREETGQVETVLDSIQNKFLRSLSHGHLLNHSEYQIDIRKKLCRNCGLILFKDGRFR